MLFIQVNSGIFCYDSYNNTNFIFFFTLNVTLLSEI